MPSRLCKYAVWRLDAVSHLNSMARSDFVSAILQWLFQTISLMATKRQLSNCHLVQDGQTDYRQFSFNPSWLLLINSSNLFGMRLLCSLFVLIRSSNGLATCGRRRGPPPIHGGIPLRPGSTMRMGIGRSRMGAETRLIVWRTFGTGLCLYAPLRFTIRMARSPTKPVQSGIEKGGAEDKAGGESSQVPAPF